MIRIYDHEHVMLSDRAARAGFTLADYVRRELGLEMEYPPKRDARPAKLARK